MLASACVTETVLSEWPWSHGGVHLAHALIREHSRIWLEITLFTRSHLCKEYQLVRWQCCLRAGIGSALRQTNYDLQPCYLDLRTPICWFSQHSPLRTNNLTCSLSLNPALVGTASHASACREQKQSVFTCNSVPLASGWKLSLKVH